MFGRCALRLRQCFHFARKRGVLSRRIVARSGPLAAGYGQVHAPCEAKTRNVHERHSAKQAHRCGVLGYKVARRKRLASAVEPQGPLPAMAATERRSDTTRYKKVSV